MLNIKIAFKKISKRNLFFRNVIEERYVAFQYYEIHMEEESGQPD